MAATRSNTRAMRAPLCLAPAVLFFFEHDGWSYDPINETPEAGRVRCAMRSVDAEQWARESGASFDWKIDPGCTSADWIDSHKDGGKYRDPWATWQCVMRDESGAVVASLGGIDFGRDDEPWGDPYRRCVEAQLAIEAMPI